MAQCQACPDLYTEHMQVKATAAQRRRLKALHWDKIRAPQAGTVWSQAAGRQLKLDFDQLESLFQARCPAMLCMAPICTA